MPNIKEDKLLLLKLKGNKNLYQETNILFSYNSNKIEGSNLSIKEVKDIFKTNIFKPEENRPIKVNDILETINHFKCVDYMIDIALEPLSEDLIKDLHKLLKEGTSNKLILSKPGEYKKLQNTVGGIETTKPENVQKEISLLIEKYEKRKHQTFEDIIEFHYEFEKIHPFADGNGRVGRLIAFK